MSLRRTLLTAALLAGAGLTGGPAHADIYMFMAGPAAGTQLYSGPGSFFISPALNGGTSSDGYIYWSDDCGIWFVGDLFGAPSKESKKYGHGLVYKLTSSDTVATEVSDVTMKALGACASMDECGKATAMSCLSQAVGITDGLAKTIAQQVGYGTLTGSQAKSLTKKVGKVGKQLGTALEGLLALSGQTAAPNLQHPLERADRFVEVEEAIVKAMALNRKVVKAMKSMKLITIVHPGE